jgi:hypothetical protein
MYLVLSAFTSNPISLVAATRASALILPDTKKTLITYLNLTQNVLLCLRVLVRVIRNKLFCYPVNKKCDILNNLIHAVCKERHSCSFFFREPVLQLDDGRNR